MTTFHARIVIRGPSDRLHLRASTMRKNEQRASISVYRSAAELTESCYYRHQRSFPIRSTVGPSARGSRPSLNGEPRVRVAERVVERQFPSAALLFLVGRASRPIVPQHSGIRRQESRSRESRTCRDTVVQ